MKPEGENMFDKFPTVTSPLTGVVLIGGKSSRMGIDKAGIDYHGAPQSRYLFQLLSVFCHHVFLSCNSEQALQISDLPLIVDDSPAMGPMGGLLSVFQLYPDKALLTVPCDLPWLDQETVAHLICYRNSQKVATTYWNSERENIEPLLTIWEPAAYDVLLRYSQQGIYSPHQVLKNADVEIVPALSVLPLKNVNTRAEYEAAMKLILPTDKDFFKIKPPLK